MQIQFLNEGRIQGFQISPEFVNKLLYASEENTTSTGIYQETMLLNKEADLGAPRLRQRRGRFEGEILFRPAILTHKIQKVFVSNWGNETKREPATCGGRRGRRDSDDQESDSRLLQEASTLCCPECE
jgi:hypothetical protein